MRRAGLLVAVTGCARIFGLDEGDPTLPPADAATLDAALPPDADLGQGCVVDFNDPLRYSIIANTVSLVRATQECKERDMGPVVFTSNDEYALHRADVSTRYWTGLSIQASGTVTGFPGCTPILPWAAKQPDTSVGACVVVGDQFAYEVHSCTSEDANVLCETPPRTTACDAQAQPHPDTDYLAVPSGNSRDGHAGACPMGMHLIEINTGAELSHALALLPNLSFWIVAEWDTTDWRPSPSGCPMEYQWAAGQPTNAAARQCVAYEPAAGGLVLEDCGMLKSAICEVDR